MNLFITNDSFVKRAVIGSLAIDLGLLLILALAIKHLPPELPLWYSRAWGEEQVVSRSILFLVPITTLALLIISIALSRFTDKQILNLRVLFGGTFTATFLGAITVIRIVFLVW